MRITYLNHACLLIETSDAKIVTDPWSAGPAYLRQWHPFPRAIRPERADEGEVILISHAHEDHLHEPTLTQLGKKKRVFYPFHWYGGTVDWLGSMGFADVTEASSCRTYELGPRTKVTYVVNSHDSIMVIEADGQVLVNVNDALHSYEPSVIDSYTRYLRERWPRIDTVFCGFGGASYYPNTVHGPGKDDREVAWLREQLFAHNFCRIVKNLDPRVAVPFAADFALLAPEQRWINEVRFGRELLPRYFADQGGRAEIVIMHSEDRLANGRLEKLSPNHERTRDARRTAEFLHETYPEPISALLPGRSVPGGEVDAVAAALEANVAEQSQFYDPDRVRDLRFSVKLRDATESPYLDVEVRPGGASVQRASHPAPAGIAVVDTTHEVLAHCLASDWGGDAMIIGYACDVQVRDAKELASGRGKLVVELCVRHPRPRVHMKENPLRVARFLAETPFALEGRLKEKARSALGRSRKVVDGPHWLRGSASEIRRVCGLPVVPPPPARAHSSQ